MFVYTLFTYIKSKIQSFAFEILPKITCKNTINNCKDNYAVFCSTYVLYIRFFNCNKIDLFLNEIYSLPGSLTAGKAWKTLELDRIIHMTKTILTVVNILMCVRQDPYEKSKFQSVSGDGPRMIGDFDKTRKTRLLRVFI